ncbi:DUF3263 domain-containing protein [Rothia sp. P6271]|uniref:DUF3263 domain-containing protein n=1 Tax=Rothia sp. P6271 TaxID=3402659 RepID=UPI003AC65518
MCEDTSELYAPQHTPDTGLTEQEEKMIALEKQRWRYPGTKERVIRERLGLNPTAYYQILNELIDSPRVIAQEPALMRRLREQRDNSKP